ncbi:hypothetical protein M976_02715 [Buttiauxella ferragutiae ATCC 51602]|uniref:RiboL-PSP-HEPN domain-containing protein n=2 Tax=Buttiauxella ferragutiae TaxID=82989 RepID=A0ABX2W6M7_9ENTR|nr:hypothetical protein M976_02715 [Buttiauxella ferragutiae ATCC 51602]
MQLQCCTQHIAYLNEIEIIANAAIKELNDGENVKANAMTRSGLVLLCGYFEGFIREMCNEFVEVVNDAGIKCDLIPKETLSEHFDECVELYKRHKKEKFNKTVDSLLNNQALVFNAKKLSATNANPTVDNIDKIFSRFGIEHVLDKLSLSDFSLANMYNVESQVTNDLSKKINELSGGDVDLYQGLVAAIESKWSGKKKRRRVGYLIVIDQLLEKRNMIAHGEGYVFITPEELLATKHSIQKLCSGLVNELEQKLIVLIPPSQTQPPQVA